MLNLNKIECQNYVTIMAAQTGFLGKVIANNINIAELPEAQQELCLKMGKQLLQIKAQLNLLQLQAEILNSSAVSEGQ